MRQQYGLVCLLLLFISVCRAQDSTPSSTGPTEPLPDWYGDPKLCTTNPPVTPSSLPQPPFPKFGNQAEFALERVQVESILGFTIGSEMTLYEYLYDYNANMLIMVKNKNGFIDAEYINYAKLKNSTYLRGEYCVVTDVPKNEPMNGASAIQLSDGTWHVRPLDEFLLFYSNAPGREITPIYLGKDTIRGIPVDTWQSCFINKTDYRTVRRIWHFAQQGYVMPTGPVGEYAYPVQALISGSYTFPNGTSLIEIDEVYNVHAFRHGIMETADALAPPKGVFCANPVGQPLVTLSDIGVRWPNRFSVRVEASSSRSAQWQRFHLFYDNGREGSSRRVRYDYMPVGAEDFRSVIHDYTDQLTYVIDRRLGTCTIDRGVAIPEVSPIRDPIQFFIKNEEKFIYNPPPNAWELNGFRPCRGTTIQCTILTTSLEYFPAIVESDTGAPTGETWLATNVEYGWSMRSPTARPRPNSTKEFDYPVSLYLKMYRFRNPTNPSPYAIITEDIEYEFYEMSHDRQPDDFDISICYRSRNYDYLHLIFVLELSQGNIIDGNHLNRVELEWQTHRHLRNVMNIKSSRLSDVEIDHERVSNNVTVFLTVLGKTNFDDTGSTAEEARKSLEGVLNRGEFRFSVTLEDDSTVQFRGVSNSLQASKLYKSVHAVGKPIIKESYTSGSQALAIIVGLLIGLFVGIVIAAVIRIVRKEPMPSPPTSIRNPLPAINFHTKKSNDSSTSNA